MILNDRGRGTDGGRPAATRPGGVAARNAVYLIVNQAVIVLLGFLITVLVSRYLGPSALGKLRLAASVWAIGAILMAAGTDTLLFKETARAPSRVYELFVTAAALRLGLGLLVFGAILIWARASRYSPDTLAVIVIVGVATLLTQIGDISRAVLQGLEQVGAVTLGGIASRVFRTIAVAAVLWAGRGVLHVAAVSIGAAFIETLFPLRDMWRRGRVSVTLRLEAARWMLRDGLPFFASALFLVCYGQVDVIVLSLLASEAELGWYGAAVQFLSTLSILPAVVGTVLLPIFVRTSVDDPQSLPALMGRAFNIVMVMAVPVGLGLAALAEPIIDSVYGPSFGPSAPVLALVGAVVALAYQNTLVACCLNATDRQGRVTRLLGAAVLATIPLDLICIPWAHRVFGNGAIGAAVTYIITESGMLVLLIRALPAGTLGIDTLRCCLRALTAGAAMMAVMWLARHSFVLVPLCLGMAVYAGLALVLRLLLPEDWCLLADVWRALAARWRRADDQHIAGIISSS